MKVIGNAIGAAIMIGSLGGLAMASEDVAWPDLPATRMTSGRSATQDDVDRGIAVFSLQGSGKPSAITVPQYVYWTDEAGVKHPMILIQAEDAPNGMTIIGLREFAGGYAAGTLAEVELLGTRKPK